MGAVADVGRRTGRVGDLGLGLTVVGDDGADFFTGPAAVDELGFAAFEAADTVGFDSVDRRLVFCAILVFGPDSTDVFASLDWSDCREVGPFGIGFFDIDFGVVGVFGDSTEFSVAGALEDMTVGSTWACETVVGACADPASGFRVSSAVGVFTGWTWTGVVFCGDFCFFDGVDGLLAKMAFLGLEAADCSEISGSNSDPLRSSPRDSLVDAGAPADSLMTSLGSFCCSLGACCSAAVLSLSKLSESSTVGCSDSKVSFLQPLTFSIPLSTLSTVPCEEPFKPFVLSPLVCERSSSVVPSNRFL